MREEEGEQRKRQQETETDADRQHVTLPNWLANCRRDIKADRAATRGSTDGGRKWNCQVQQRCEYIAFLYPPPRLSTIFSLSRSLSFTSSPLSLSLPAISFACCICLRLKSTLKFINDNGQARPRRGQGSGKGQGRGGHKTMDARLTTLCSSLSEDTLINPCHILLFCHFSRRGESSRAESSRVEKLLLLLLLLLLLQTHHLFWIYSAIIQNTSADWHTDKRTHGQLSGQTNEQEISLLLTHPDIPPGLVWQAQLSTDYFCASPPPPFCPLGND